MTELQTSRRWPWRLYALLLGLFGLVIATPGAYLVLLGGSPYYLLAGLSAAGSGVLLWRGSALARSAYALMLALTLVWALWEVGFDLWALLPRIVGLPLLRGLGSIRWSKDGTVELGRLTPQAPQDEPNLVFDRGLLLLKAEVLGKTVLMSLDTGATSTDLNANFAGQFPMLVADGRKTTQDITGAGGTRTFDAIELPEVGFAIGAARVLLRPAHVTLQRITGIGGTCCVGNAGHDLLSQGSSLSIDFSRMTLRVNR